MNVDKHMGIGVRAMIVNENKVLLGKRRYIASKASNPLHGGGTWTMPGGKIEFGQNIEEVMAREVFEETKLKIDPQKARIISVAMDIINNVQFVTLGFLIDGASGEPQDGDNGEETDWQWFDLEKLPENLFFPTAKVFENYFAKKIY